jgi:hypothetical protein
MLKPTIANDNGEFRAQATKFMANRAGALDTPATQVLELESRGSVPQVSGPPFAFIRDGDGWVHQVEIDFTGLFVQVPDPDYLTAVAVFPSGAVASLRFDYEFSDVSQVGTIDAMFLMDHDAEEGEIEDRNNFPLKLQFQLLVVPEKVWRPAPTDA